MLKNLLITKKIRELLKNKNLTGYKLSKIIGISDGSMYAMIRGQAKFPEDKIQKIAPILEVSPEEIKGWILADKYPKEVLQLALSVKKEHAGKKKLIFTAKIHQLMKERKLGISEFSREMDYNQGWLSQVVLGKEPVSDKLMQKLCDFSGLSREQITSWSVADKYSAEALSAAVSL